MIRSDVGEDNGPRCLALHVEKLPVGFSFRRWNGRLVRLALFVIIDFESGELVAAEITRFDDGGGQPLKLIRHLVEELWQPPVVVILGAGCRQKRVRRFLSRIGSECSFPHVYHREDADRIERALDRVDVDTIFGAL